MNSNTILLRFLPIRYERLLAEKLLHHYNNIYICGTAGYNIVNHYRNYPSSHTFTVA